MSLMRPLLAVLFSTAAACGSDGGGGGGSSYPDAGPELNDPESARLFPLEIHTGYDGSAEFRVPVYTDLSKHVFGEAQWSTGDSSIVQVEPVDEPSQYPSRGVWAMLTTKGPGQTTVTATIGDYLVGSTVTVASYTPAQVAAGQARYNGNGTGDRVSCASCHQQAGGVDHSPTEMAHHDDDALLTVITEGHYPDLCVTDEGDECTCGTSGCETEPGYVLSVEHQWNLTEDEAAGIVPYLRSLAPRGF